MITTAQVWTPLLTRCAAKRWGREGTECTFVRTPRFSNGKRWENDQYGLPSCITIWVQYIIVYTVFDCIQNMICRYCWIWTLTNGFSKLVPGSISPGISTCFSSFFSSVADPFLSHPAKELVKKDNQLGVGLCLILSWDHSFAKEQHRFFPLRRWDNRLPQHLKRSFWKVCVRYHVGRVWKRGYRYL